MVYENYMIRGRLFMQKCIFFRVTRPVKRPLIKICISVSLWVKNNRFRSATVSAEFLLRFLGSYFQRLIFYALGLLFFSK